MSQVYQDQPLWKWQYYIGPTLDVAPVDGGNYTWGNYTPTNLIQPLHYWLQIPSITINNISTYQSQQNIQTNNSLNLMTQDGLILQTTVSNTGASLLYQFNFSVGFPFTITNWPIQALQDLNCYVTIRYILAGKVYRYNLVSMPVQEQILETESGNDVLTEAGNLIDVSPQLFPFLQTAVPYTGQVILPNFVLEVWTVPQNTATSITIPSFNILTSNQYLPSSEDNQDVFISPTAVWTVDYTAFPLIFPIQFDPLATWVSN
jgi:hypothetical protein